MMFAQAAAFEVASIKIAQPLMQQAMSGKLHAGMKIDGARVDIGSMSLADLIQAAYKVKNYQVSGPDWMKEQRFDILAKMPDGASKDDVPAMLQALLAERFKLTIHREDKEHPVYALVVGKGGPKLKESPPDSEAVPEKEPQGGTVIEAGDQKVRVTQDGKGGTVVHGGPNGNVHATMSNGVMHMEQDKVTLATLAEMLSRFVDRPVVDMTGLKGNFDITLDLTMQDMMNAARAAGVALPMPGGAASGAASSKPSDAASDPGESSIFTTIQQLGLKLEARKLPVETIMVDHLEKLPTEN